MAFEDHFSGHAAEYEAYRPDYPPALFSRAAALAAGRETAWDCGTGSGQAAVALADHFSAVVATDASAEQIAQARPHRGVSYRVAPAEASGLPEASIDLVFVAQALHWFDHPRFWDEVRRVTRPGAAFVAVTYARCHVLDETGAAVGAAVEAFYDVVEPWWPAQRAHVEAGYRTIPCPFPPEDLGALTLERRWDLEALLGYLGTWSATRRAWRALGHDPRDAVRARLEAAWGSPETRRLVSWPLSAIAARVRDETGRLRG